MHITAGADGFAVHKALKKRRRKLDFFFAFSRLPHMRHPCGGWRYCLIRTKVFWSSKNLFFKKGSWQGSGRSPAYTAGRGSPSRRSPGRIPGYHSFRHKLFKGGRSRGGVKPALLFKSGHIRVSQKSVHGAHLNLYAVPSGGCRRHSFSYAAAP